MGISKLEVPAFKDYGINLGPVIVVFSRVVVWAFQGFSLHLSG